MLKYKVFIGKTRNKQDSDETSWSDLRLRVLADIEKEININNIISIADETWVEEQRPSPSNHKTWFNSKCVSIKVYYNQVSNETNSKLEELRSKLVVFKMIAQFMYSTTDEDGVEYFDDYCESAGEAAFGFLGFKDDRISKEEFYAEYDKLLREMSALDGVDRNWNLEDWYKKDKAERDEHRRNNVLICATETNWGQFCSCTGEWLSTSYMIYKNGRFEIIKSFDSRKNGKSVQEEYELTYSGKLSEEDLKSLEDLLKNRFKAGKDTNGCDGIGWNIKSYAKDTEETFEGYIPGDDVLKELVRILYSLQ